MLKKKILSSGYNNNTGLETENYAYNIRGWLLGVNRDYVKDGNSSNYFGFDLGNDKSGVLGTYNTLQCNGNISGTIWKNKGDQQNRKYDYAYDAVNQIVFILIISEQLCIMVSFFNNTMPNTSFGIFHISNISWNYFLF